MPKGKLHIGWSQIEITPPKKTLLQGQFHARLADTAISPLTAGCVRAVLTGHWHISDMVCNDRIYHCQTGSMIEFP